MYQAHTSSTENGVRKILAQKAEEASRAEMRLRFLNLRHLPASSSMEESGWLTGHNEEEIGILLACGHLSPLGNPAANGKKRLSTQDVIAAGNDPKWLNDSCKIITAYWRKKNEQTQKKKNQNPQKDPSI